MFDLEQILHQMPSLTLPSHLSGLALAVHKLATP